MAALVRSLGLEAAGMTPRDALDLVDYIQAADAQRKHPLGPAPRLILAPLWESD